MTSVEFGALMFGVCLLLIALRMPVAIAMFVTGGFGFASLAGWPAFLNLLNTVPSVAYPAIRCRFCRCSC